MILLPNECLFKIFNNFQTDHGSLFSCLLVNSQWCRIIVQILWSEPTVHYYKNFKIIKTYLLTLNDEERALLPLDFYNPSNYEKPLFEYTSYTTSVDYYLFDSVEYLFSKRDTFFINAVKYSLIAMFLRTSRKLKNLKIRIDGIIRAETIEDICKNITIVSLSIDNRNKEPFGSELIEIINENTTMTSLKLLGGYLGYEGNRALVDALCKNTTLTSLVLSCDQRLEILAKALSINNTLTSLKISGSEFDGEEGFTEALCKNTALTSLTIKYLKLGFNGKKALAKALCKNTSLTSFTLKLTSRISDLRGIKELASGICKNIALTSLTLNGLGRLGSENDKALAEILRKNATLTSLNLRGNQFCTEGVKALTEALCENNTLISLDFSKNFVDYEGGKAFAESLCKNNTLTSLNLSSNYISTNGGIALAEALGKNTSLTSLNIGNNMLGYKVAKALEEALCKNKSLTSLSIGCNQLDCEAAKALARALCKNTTLTFLDLSNSRFIRFEGAKALMEVFHICTLKFCDEKPEIYRLNEFILQR